MNKKLKNIKPIKDEIRTVLEEFLAVPEYQDIFMVFAKHMGYTGDNLTEAKKALFTTQEDQIGFKVVGMNDLFLEFQLLKQLKIQEPYKSLLESRPEAISQLRELAKKILKNEEVTNKDIEKIFKDGKKDSIKDSE